MVKFNRGKKLGTSEFSSSGGKTVSSAGISVVGSSGTTGSSSITFASSTIAGCSERIGSSEASSCTIGSSTVGSSIATSGVSSDKWLSGCSSVISVLAIGSFSIANTADGNNACWNNRNEVAIIRIFFAFKNSVPLSLS